MWDPAHGVVLMRLTALAMVPPLMPPFAQGGTLVHFSAQREPCLTQERTLNTLSTR